VGVGATVVESGDLTRLRQKNERLREEVTESHPGVMEMANHIDQAARYREQAKLTNEEVNLNIWYLISI
jgi:hypothetical protein